MEIKLNNKVMNWDEVRFDITLMAYERIFSEFLRRDIFKLGWFQGYQKGDLQRLEAILHQADQQYESLPGEEQQWIDELQEFYTDFNSFAELRQAFPGADKVDNLTVFNIGGNKARLIAAIHYNTRRIYIRHVLTHKEYDRGYWRK